MSIKATQPEDSAVTDEQILALNADERFFSESPTKYPESGHGTQYHAGAPGVIGFARAVLALATPSPQPAATKEAGGEALRNVQRYRMSTQFHSMNRDDAGPYVQLDDVLTALAAAPQPAEAKTAAVDGMTDAARLDFMCQTECFIEHDDKGMWRLYRDVAMKGDPRHRWEAFVTRWRPSAREAIDAAIATQEGGQP